MLNTTLTIQDSGGASTFSISKTYSETFKIEQEVSTTFMKLVGFNPHTKSAQNMEDCKLLVLRNIASVPAEIKYTMGIWTDGTPDSPTYGDNRHINQILLPDEFIVLPNVRFLDIDGAIATNSATLDNVAPSSTGTSDSTANIDEGAIWAIDDTTLTVTDGYFFKVNDYLIIESEIIKVTAVSTNDLTVVRGRLGTTAATHANATDIYFYFYNKEYPNDSAVKTDKNGKFECSNFFGYARTDDGDADGLVSGTVAIKFYNSGYQELGMDAQTSSTDTGLTASTQYYFKITKDGGSETEYDITTDSSNVNWGGTNGVLTKIQDELDDNNLDVTVALVGGDIRFTSDSHLSTSAIALTDGTTGTSLFGTGQVPAEADMQYAVGAELPDDTYYEAENNTSRKNAGVFLLDSGDGTLTRTEGGSGTINYETGALTMTGCPADAEFVVSGNYDSAFSGEQTWTLSEDSNIIESVQARSVNYKANSKIQVIAFG